VEGIGILRRAQDDSKDNGNDQLAATRVTAKTKCGGLSIAAAQSAAFGRDDASLGGEKSQEPV
jgi:hypothetical protein